MKKTGGFVIESALHDLLRYAGKYHEPVSSYIHRMVVISTECPLLSVKHSKVIAILFWKGGGIH